MKKAGMSTVVKALLASLVLTVAMHSAAFAIEVKPEYKKNPKVLWDQLGAKWNKEVNSYSTDIFSWGYKTPNYIKNFTTGKDKDGKTIEPDWGYKIFKVRFLKPNLVLFSYKYSAHENTEEGSLIDKAVAYVLRYTEGTTFNYGKRGTDVAYIKFPYISNKKFEELPVPIVMKAAMKLLMIASRNEIYQRPLSELTDCRGYAIDSLIIGVTMKKFDKAFNNLSDKNYVVSVEASPRLGKDDYTLDEKTGWVSMKKSALSKPTEVYKLTLMDKNKARNKGVEKIEAFIDPATNMFIGLHEYESGKLVYVTHFLDLKLNDPGIKAAEWDDFFKGRNINVNK